MLRGDDIQETCPASPGSLPGRQQNCCCDPESQGAHRKLPRGLLSRAFSKCGDTANCESVASQTPGPWLANGMRLGLSFLPWAPVSLQVRWGQSYLPHWSHLPPGTF